MNKTSKINSKNPKPINPEEPCSCAYVGPITYEMIFNPRAEKIWQKYHTFENGIGYYLPALPQIMGQLENSDKVVISTYGLLEEYLSKTKTAPSVGVLPAAYYMAARTEGQNRNETQIADVFGVSTAELKQGLREIAKATSPLYQKT
jgi:hypothetical protein